MPCAHCAGDLKGADLDGPCPHCAAPVVDSVTTAPPGRRAGPVHCVECAYDLTGLPTDAVCPECATPVERSLRGALLANAGDAYLHTIRNGARLVVTALLASVVLTLATIAATFSFGFAGALGAPGAPPPTGVVSTLMYINLGSAIGGVALAFLSFAGWWFLTQPDPAFTGRDKGQTARRLVRIAVAIRAAVTLAQLPVTLFASGALAAPAASPIVLLSIVGGLAAAGAWALQFFASMRYIQWLAKRIPDQPMHRTAGLYMWLLPLVYVLGAICLGLGPLVAFILYLVLLDQLRRQISRTIRMREVGA
ncbi:MAG: hypothetical protein ACF8QF_09525 [Phycisphaerales bacterium]